MDAIKQRLLTNWGIMRILRLAIGIWLLVEGIQTHDWVVGSFSAFFLYQAITDTGCCGTKGCYTPARQPTKRKVVETKDIEYEEIN